MGKHGRTESFGESVSYAPDIPLEGVGQEASFCDEPQLNDVTMPKKQPLGIRFLVAFVCALAFVGSSAAFAAVVADQAPVEKSKPVVPETVQASVKVDGVLISGPTLQRGDELQNIAEATELTGSYAGKYYRAEFDGKVLYIPKRWVRTADETAPQAWTGYAAEDAIIFAKHDFSGDDLLTLSLNEEVEVLDSFNGLLYVKNADGFEGYIAEEKILREKAEEPEVPAVSTPAPSVNSGNSNSKPSSGSNASSGSSSSGSKPSSGSNSGGSSSGSGGSGSGGSGSGSGSSGSSTGTDGEDMALPTAVSYDASPSARSMFGVEIAYADEPKSQPASGLSGVVLADNIGTRMGMLNRGDVVIVKVDDKLGAGGALSEDELAALSPEEKDNLGSTEDVCTVIINEQEFELPEKLLRFADEPAYEVWDGFAIEDATAYRDYRLKTKPLELEENDAIRVVDSVDDVLIVEIDAATYYISSKYVSREQVEEADQPEEQIREESSRPSSSASSSSSSGSSSSKPSSSSSASSGDSSSNKPSSGSGSGGSSSGGSGSGGSSGSGSGSGSNEGSTSTEDEWSAPVL